MIVFHHYFLQERIFGVDRPFTHPELNWKIFVLKDRYIRVNNLHQYHSTPKSSLSFLLIFSRGIRVNNKISIKSKLRFGRQKSFYVFPIQNATLEKTHPLHRLKTERDIIIIYNQRCHTTIQFSSPPFHLDPNSTLTCFVTFRTNNNNNNIIMRVQSSFCLISEVNLNIAELTPTLFFIFAG